MLLHDLCNIANDRAAEARTLTTTDELYTSGPYFSPAEATLIKTTLVLPPILNEIPEFETLEFGEAEKETVEIAQALLEDETALRQPLVPPELITIETAIKSRLQTFFEKRRASGDARPCGPHDMGPIYLAVFSITRGGLKDKKFLSRLKRNGLPSLEAETKAGGKNEKKAKKGGKKGARG